MTLQEQIDHCKLQLAHICDMLLDARIAEASDDRDKADSLRTRAALLAGDTAVMLSREKVAA